MKKIKFAAFAVAILAAALALFSCAASSGGENEDEKLTIIATIFPQYDLARAVAGDLANVSMMMSPETESHTYEPSLRDIADVGASDIFIYTGSGLDEWAEDIAALFGDEIISVSTADAVTLVLDDDGDEYDEHIWTSPKNAIKILNLILEAIVSADPENEAAYRENAEAYLSLLERLDLEFEAVAEALDGKTVVVADRFPFKYLFDDYGIDYIAALDGCSSDSEPSPAVIAEMITMVAEDNIPCVYIVEFSEGKTASLISEATGCRVLLLHSCHNVTAEDLEGGVTYVDIMTENIESLRNLCDN
ncbi:MAG: metal ABC transporter substrate-binding protein [Clostridiales bacterium]|nr:metal ABC transporter substrate-binding protein [Clostridiales bacterium]